MAPSRLKNGLIQVQPGNGRPSGKIVIDLVSGASGNSSRDKRMHKEILESQKYPEAVFLPIPDRFEGNIAPSGASAVDLHGTFRIHGADQEMTLHFQVQAARNQDVVTTHFTIPYVQWGMKNPSNFLLKVDDKVEVDVRAEVTPSLDE